MAERELHIIDSRPGIVHMGVIDGGVEHRSGNLLETDTETRLDEESAVLELIEEIEPCCASSGGKGCLRHIIDKGGEGTVRREPEEMMRTDILRFMQTPKDIGFGRDVFGGKLAQLIQTVFPPLGCHEPSLSLQYKRAQEEYG